MLTPGMYEGFRLPDGRVPKNDKTLCYPNQYFEVTNFNGGNQKFRLEFFGTKGTASFD